jgi:hypothetical protein
MSMKWRDTSLSHTYEKANGPTDSEVQDLRGQPRGAAGVWENKGGERGSRGRISDLVLLSCLKQLVDSKTLWKAVMPRLFLNYKLTATNVKRTFNVASPTGSM